MRVKRVGSGEVPIPFAIARLQISRVLLCRPPPDPRERQWLQRWCDGVAVPQLVATDTPAALHKVYRALDRALLTARRMDAFAPWFEGDRPPAPPKWWRGERQCVGCGRPFLRRHRSEPVRVCSAFCRVGPGLTDRELLPVAGPVSRPCAWCGHPFTPTRRRGRIPPRCSPGCDRAQRNDRVRQRRRGCPAARG